MDPDPAATERLRGALAGLIDRKPETALFTPAMQRFLRTGVGREMFAWAAADGSIRSFAFSTAETDGDSRVLRYRTVLGDVARTYTFRLTPEGKIAQVRWW